jgi:hypothetical protein
LDGDGSANEQPGLYGKGLAPASFAVANRLSSSGHFSSKMRSAFVFVSNFLPENMIGASSLSR